eukprot:2842939-Prorocentrum_lima.AAC.1
MEPPIQQRSSTRDPEGHPLWVRYDGPTRRTTPYLAGIRDGDDENDEFDIVNLGKEVPLTALKA